MKVLKAPVSCLYGCKSPRMVSHGECVHMKGYARNDAIHGWQTGRRGRHRSSPLLMGCETEVNSPEVADGSLDLA